MKLKVLEIYVVLFDVTKHAKNVCIKDFSMLMLKTKLTFSLVVQS